MKFCKDCRFHLPKRFLWFTVGNAFCGHEKAADRETDVVTGETRVDRHFCYYMRGVGHKWACGADAKLFEPRQP